MAARPNPVPSSSTNGFFQQFPTLPPQFTSPEPAGGSSEKGSRPSSDDVILPRILRLYLPPKALSHVSEAVHNLSRRVQLPSTLKHSVDAEVDLPTLHRLGTFGQRNDVEPLRTSEGWQALKRMSIEEGTVSRAYDESTTSWNRRVEQFGLVHVWAAPSAMVMCPMSMTDGAASLLYRHRNDTDGDQPGRKAVVAEAYRRLVSSDPSYSWTSGQWMTERAGGSDVSRTETVATRLTREDIAEAETQGLVQDSIGNPLGPWCLDGFKWFSSATDSDMAVLLAQTTKGLSAFFVPMRRRVGYNSQSGADGDNVPTELNGIRMQRLKEKLGTKALPTAELEIQGARGWLIGEEGRGVKEISTILNITRIHAAASSAAFWARGLAVCRAFSKVRETRGAVLYKNVQHASWMANETVKYWAATHLAMFGPALLGCNEQSWEQTAKNTPSARLIPQDRTARETLLRLLTPVMKARVSTGAVDGVRAAMECLGGVGYSENNEDGGVLNVAKLYRDSMVNVIWEGTVSVMADDVGRVLRDKRIGGGNVLGNVFGPWVQSILSHCRGHFKEECAVVEERLERLQALVTNVTEHELQWRGREVLDHLEAITSSVLMLYDACIDMDQVMSHAASRWVWYKALPDTKHRRQRRDWKQEAIIDRQIFIGAEENVSSRL